MLNARNSMRLLAMAALLTAPAFHGAVAGDDDKKAAPVLDLNARLQQTLNAKLNGQMKKKNAIPEDELDGELTARVDEQQAEAAEELEAQASTLTSAKRGEDEEKKTETQAAETATR
ncbi:MAG TPA: hypothetical protein VF254_01935 [Gammaproteobacteria bacterium]